MRSRHRLLVNYGVVEIIILVQFIYYQLFCKTFSLYTESLYVWYLIKTDISVVLMVNSGSDPHKSNLWN
jgi:uncharacterized membrane protein